MTDYCLNYLTQLKYIWCREIQATAQLICWRNSTNWLPTNWPAICQHEYSVLCSAKIPWLFPPWCLFGPWWRHQMETFSAWLALCAVNSPATGEFPAQRPVTWSFDVFFDLRLNKRLGKQMLCWWFETPSHSLWRHYYVRSTIDGPTSHVPCLQVYCQLKTRYNIILHTRTMVVSARKGQSLSH